MITLHQGFVFFCALLATLAVSFGIYRYFRLRYDEIEGFVLDKISNYTTEIYGYFDRMYRPQTMDRCRLMIVLPTAILGFLGFALGIRFGVLIGFLFMGILGWFGYVLPGKILKFVFKKRVEKFDRQLVDALSMMSNAIKSGLSFMQVMQVIEREMPNPCSQEFGMVLKENRVGVNLSDALINMTKRMPSDDLFMIINSVVTLSQQGGDISEAFDTIAKTIRERQKVTEKIRTLSQAALTQATILSAIPFFVMGMQQIIQPQYLRLLFVTPIGIGLLVLMFGLIITGALVMKKIMTIDV